MKNKHAQQLGKLGGKVKSEAKAKAVRENGKLGGRPHKHKVEFMGDGVYECKICHDRQKVVIMPNNGGS